jgi:hypothetical protein
MVRLICTAALGDALIYIKRLESRQGAGLKRDMRMPFRVSAAMTTHALSMRRAKVHDLDVAPVIAPAGSSGANGIYPGLLEPAYDRIYP